MYLNKLSIGLICCVILSSLSVTKGGEYSAIDITSKPKSAWRSETHHGLYVSVRNVLSLPNSLPNAPTASPGSRIAWHVKTKDTNMHTIYYTKNLATLCEATMYDAQGRLVERTASGKNIANKLKEMPKLDFDKWRKNFWITRVFDAPHIDDVSWGGGGTIMIPSEVFDLKTPGVYRLTLKFQFYVIPPKRSDAVPVIMPPINVPVVVEKK